MAAEERYQANAWAKVREVIKVRPGEQVDRRLTAQILNTYYASI